MNNAEGSDYERSSNVGGHEAKTVRWRTLKSFIQMCDTSLRASSLRVTVISFIFNKSINYRSAKKTSLYTLNVGPLCCYTTTLTTTSLFSGRTAWLYTSCFVASFFSPCLCFVYILPAIWSPLCTGTHLKEASSGVKKKKHKWGNKASLCPWYLSAGFVATCQGTHTWLGIRLASDFLCHFNALPPSLFLSLWPRSISSAHGDVHKG